LIIGRERDIFADDGGNNRSNDVTEDFFSGLFADVLFDNFKKSGSREFLRFDHIKHSVPNCFTDVELFDHMKLFTDYLKRLRIESELTIAKTSVIK
jgi:hypothetical protein